LENTGRETANLVVEADPALKLRLSMEDGPLCGRELAQARALARVAGQDRFPMIAIQV
jgi:hypothetical protein